MADFASGLESGSKVASGWVSQYYDQQKTLRSGEGERGG